MELINDTKLLDLIKQNSLILLVGRIIPRSCLH